jgi:hypothetical protein
MKNALVRQPYFLPQPCDWPPLLVSKPDTARLLSIGRSQVKELIDDGYLQLVGTNGFERVTMASILEYVDHLTTAKKKPATSRTTGPSF